MRKLWKAGDIMQEGPKITVPALNSVKIRCTACEEVKSEEEFHKQSSSFLGRNRKCKTCKKEIRPAQHLWSEYGMTPEEYNNILERQGGMCGNKACTYGKDDDHKLFVDHCHETNVVRGLLCHWCNAAEGFLKSSPEVAQGLIDYMEKHNLKTNERS